MEVSWHSSNVSETFIHIIFWQSTNNLLISLELYSKYTYNFLTIILINECFTSKHSKMFFVDRPGHCSIRFLLFLHTQDALEPRSVRSKLNWNDKNYIINNYLIYSKYTKEYILNCYKCEHLLSFASVYLQLKLLNFNVIIVICSVLKIILNRSFSVYSLIQWSFLFLSVQDQNKPTLPICSRRFWNASWAYNT